MALLLYIFTLLQTITAASFNAADLARRADSGPLCPEVDGSTYTDERGVGYVIRCGWDTSGLYRLDNF